MIDCGFERCVNVGNRLLVVDDADDGENGKQHNGYHRHDDGHEFDSELFQRGVYEAALASDRETSADVPLVAWSQAVSFPLSAQSR